MKRELSAVEIAYLIKELDFEGAIVDKVYSYEGDLFFQFHKQGKKLLLVRNKILFLAEDKPDMGKPSGRVMLLRKYLEGERVKKVYQPGIERVIVFELSNNKQIVLELFGRGGVILLENGKTIPEGEKYNIPSRSFPQFSEFADNFNESPISKYVAGFIGKVYAFESCLRAGVDVKAKADKKQLKAVYDSVKDLFNQSLKPELIKQNGVVIDAVPFHLKYYDDYSCEITKSFSFALGLSSVEEVSEPPALKKARKAIEFQKTHIKELAVEEQDCQRAGELIYENYGEIQSILDELALARRTMSWDEIKKNVKNPKIKHIDEKKGVMVLEL